MIVGAVAGTVEKAGRALVSLRDRIDEDRLHDAAAHTYGTVRAIRGDGDSSALIESRHAMCETQHPAIHQIGDDVESSLDISRDVKHALRMTSLFDITGS